MTTSVPPTTPKRTHFPHTTSSQRQLLFRTWEDSGDVKLACETAHVCQRTFYKWKPRFKAGGYEALKSFKSHAPKNPNRTAKEVENKVITLRKSHPNWGKRSIANELAKENNWVPLVSPNTVRRILEDAGLWTVITETSSPKGPSGAARTAEKPGQCINVDLAFVPVSHEAERKLPAVSGSSGRLVVERVAEDSEDAPQWPGRVFEDKSLSYEEAMESFAAASAGNSKDSQSGALDSSEDATIKAQKKAIHQEEEALRIERRQIREQRKQEDSQWTALREQRRAQKAAIDTHKQTPAQIHRDSESFEVTTTAQSDVAANFSEDEGAASSEVLVLPNSKPPSKCAGDADVAVSATNDTPQILSQITKTPESTMSVRPVSGEESSLVQTTDSLKPDAPANSIKEQTIPVDTSASSITDEQWKEQRDKRRAKIAQRQNEDEQWREKRKSIRERLAELPIITNWFAVLVIIDNCTRVCYGLPLFFTGAKVTAEEVVNALECLLPPELMFLISDRGVHFRAKVFEALAERKEFLHAFTARHRPQSNGIAERFVRTFKEWLADKTWSSEEELHTLLSEFKAMYNDRPHQGIPMPGLSPNKYAERIMGKLAA